MPNFWKIGNRPSRTKFLQGKVLCFKDYNFKKSCENEIEDNKKMQSIQQ